MEYVRDVILIIKFFIIVVLNVRNTTLLKKDIKQMTSTKYVDCVKTVFILIYGLIVISGIKLILNVNIVDINLKSLRNNEMKT